MSGIRKVLSMVGEQTAPAVERVSKKLFEATDHKVIQSVAHLDDAVRDVMTTQQEDAWHSLENVLTELTGGVVESGRRLKLQDDLSKLVDKFKAQTTEGLDDIVKRAQEYHGISDTQMPKVTTEADSILELLNRGQYHPAEHRLNISENLIDGIERVKGEPVKYMPNSVRNFFKNTTNARAQNVVGHEMSHARTGIQYNQLSEAEFESVFNRILKELDIAEDSFSVNAVKHHFDFAPTSQLKTKAARQEAEEALGSIVTGLLRSASEGGQMLPKGYKEYLLTADEILARRHGAVFEVQGVLKKLTSGDSLSADEVSKLKRLTGELSLNRQLKELSHAIRTGASEADIKLIEDSVKQLAKRSDLKHSITGAMVRDLIKREKGMKVMANMTKAIHKLRGKEPSDEVKQMIDKLS